MQRFALWALVLTPFCGTAVFAEETDEATDKRHKQFEEALSGARLTGLFTIDGKDIDPKAESYTIKKVTWLDIDDLWAFDVHM